MPRRDGQTELAYENKLKMSACTNRLTDGARRSKEDVDGFIDPHVDGFVDPHVDGVAQRLFACTCVVTGYHAAVITHL